MTDADLKAQNSRRRITRLMAEQAARRRLNAAQEEVARLQAANVRPPSASAMERADRVEIVHFSSRTLQAIDYQATSDNIARAIEAAEREARAEYVETSRKLRAEAVKAARAEAFEGAAQAARLPQDAISIAAAALHEGYNRLTNQDPDIHPWRSRESCEIDAVADAINVILEEIRERICALATDPQEKPDVDHD